MIMELKIKTRPFTFEIEVNRIDGEIPEEDNQEFKEWLEFQPLKVGVGRNYEYFTTEGNQDIGVVFSVKRIPNWRGIESLININ